MILINSALKEKLRLIRREKGLNERRHCLVNCPLNSMALTLGENIPEIGSEYPQRNLIWCFKPIFYAMQIFGIDLDANQQHSVTRRYAFTALKMIVFGFSCYWSVETIVTPERFLQRIDGRESSSAFTYLVSRSVFSPLLVGLIFATSMLKWKALWEKLQKVDCSTLVKSYNQIHQATATALIIFVLLVFNRLIIIYINDEILNDDVQGNC